jgi:transcriptional regulator with XRE-family HTH domain
MLTTGNQLKAARALGGVEQIALAEAAGVSVGTIRNMEAQGAATLKSSLAIIKSVQSALEARGIEFLNHGEPGVKLRKAPPANG